MNRRMLAFGIAAAVFIADRWSKHIVETSFGPWDTKVIVPGFFNIIKSENPGVAFGIFAEGAPHARTLGLVAMTIAAVAILGWMLWKAHDSITSISLALITGGALGNLYDRIHAGAATDFLDFYSGHYHWYTFNLADSAICVGAGLLILSMLKSHKTGEAS
jgi:signal peptidase II